MPINVELKVGALEESITVSGQTPLVDVQNAQRTQVVERDVIDALPTTRNMQSVGAIVPGVKLSRPDVGGSQGMEQTYMRTHGADDRHTSMQVDGMSVNSSMGDGNIQAYNDDALAQQVVFQTSALAGRSGRRRRAREHDPEGRRQHLQGRRLLRRHGAELAGQQPDRRTARARASSTATSSTTCRTSTSTSAGRS